MKKYFNTLILALLTITMVCTQTGYASDANFADTSLDLDSSSISGGQILTAGLILGSLVGLSFLAFSGKSGKNDNSNNNKNIEQNSEHQNSRRENTIENRKNNNNVTITSPKLFANQVVLFPIESIDLTITNNHLSEIEITDINFNS